MIIKVLLLAGLAASAILLLRGRRTALGLLMRRSVALTTLVAGGVAVLFPGLVTDAAKVIGVGRGTDLVLYVLCIAFTLVTIATYLRMREVEDRFVELARQHALLQARMIDVRERDVTDAPVG